MAYKDKNLEFVEAKEEPSKRMKIDRDAFRKYSSAKAVGASFEIVY